jgi:hypothetical protein
MKSCQNCGKSIEEKKNTKFCSLSCSSKVTSNSGMTILSGIPGKPHPEPISRSFFHPDIS